MYFLVEIISSTKMKFVGSDSDLNRAKELAYQHSFVTGIPVEVQNERGKTIDSIITHRR